jgi:hypothetical protein
MKPILIFDLADTLVKGFASFVDALAPQLHTRLEGPLPLVWRGQSRGAGILCDRAMMPCPRSVRLQTPGGGSWARQYVSGTGEGQPPPPEATIAGSYGASAGVRSSARAQGDGSSAHRGGPRRGHVGPRAWALQAPPFGVQ